jgi:hypothetical protein
MNSLFTVVSLVIALSTNPAPVSPQEISQESLPENHLAFTLDRVNGGFEGKSEYLEGFRLSMDFTQGIPDAGLDMGMLMTSVHNQGVTGTLTYPNGATTAVEYAIVRHRNTDDIYMKTTLGYFIWERAVVEDDAVTFVIDFWYTPPARDADLAALALAAQLLADSVNWHKNDDRRCEDDVENERWSLFCALRFASLETMGEYNHHNAAMNTVRFVIDELVPNHGFEHQLMDYNNAQSTTHEDVLNLLNIATERIKREREARSRSRERR